MAFINDITINISRGTIGLTQTSFTPLIMANGSGALAASGVQTVTELTDLTDLGYNTTDPEYLMTSAMFAQSPRPSTVKVIRVTGTYTTELTTLRTTDDAWYSINIDSRLKADLNAVGTWANSNKKLFIGCSSDITSLDSRNVDREAYIIHNNSATDYPDCAWVGRVIPEDPGSTTWKWKVLSGQNASTFTSTQLNTIRTNNGQAIQTQAGATFVNEGKTTSGEFIDIIQGQDWVEDQLKIGLLSLLVNNNKVALDNTGIALVEGVVRDVLKRAGDQGIIANATDEADFALSDDKVYIYQVTVPARSAISVTDRANRTLPDVKFTYTTAGAIHKVEVTGKITV